MTEKLYSLRVLFIKGRLPDLKMLAGVAVQHFQIPYEAEPANRRWIISGRGFPILTIFADFGERGHKSPHCSAIAFAIPGSVRDRSFQRSGPGLARCTLAS